MEGTAVSILQETELSEAKDDVNSLPWSGLASFLQWWLLVIWLRELSQVHMMAADWCWSWQLSESGSPACLGGHFPSLLHCLRTLSQWPSRRTSWLRGLIQQESWKLTPGLSALPPPATLGCWCRTPRAVHLWVFLWPHIPVGWWLDLTAPILHYHILAVIFISSWCWCTMEWFNTYLRTRQEMGACRSKGQDVITSIATFPQSTGAGDFGKTSQSWKGRWTLQFVLGRWHSTCSTVTAQNYPQKPQAAHEQRSDICILSVPSRDRTAQGCPELCEHRAGRCQPWIALENWENFPKKGWMDRSLQRTSSEQVQHSHNHTFSLLRPERARTFVEPCALHNKSAFVPDVDFFD